MDRDPLLPVIYSLLLSIVIRTGTIISLLLWPLSIFGQVQREGAAVLEEGERLEGRFRYEASSLFAGVEYRKGEGDWVFLPADSLKSLRLEDERYRSIAIPKELAGYRGSALFMQKLEGKMALYRGRYRSKACSCQDYFSVREGAVLIKEGEERVHLVKKNRWFDRVKNAEHVASAFLPYDRIMEDVREREYAFSEIGKAVERFNERSKASDEP